MRINPLGKITLIAAAPVLKFTFSYIEPYRLIYALKFSFLTISHIDLVLSRGFS